MVLTGVAKKGVGGAERVMAMGPERSKHLHNFKMPTPWLTWGNQRFLRCMKVNSTANANANANAAAFDNHHRSSRSFAATETDYPLGSKRNRDFDFDFDFNFDVKQRSPKNANNSSAKRLKIKNSRYIGADDEDEGIEAVREKLTFDLKTAADNMKFEILKQGDEDEDVEEEEPSAAAAAEEVERPWNLRTRRAACKAPIVNVKNNTKFEERKASVSPLRTENPMKSSRLRVVGGKGGEKKERAKFSVSLCRKEVEQDYLEMIGERPPRRPKKRPKVVQKQVDTLFPGLWLTEVTSDMYKVSEFPESGKR